MRWVVRGVAVLAASCVGLLLWGWAMDSQWRVERSVEIAEAPGPVFAYVSILSNWPEWTAWGPAQYPNIQYEFSGPDWGVGAVQRWRDGDMQGELRVTEFQPGEYMEYLLEMEPGAVHVRGSLRIEPVADGSRLTWSCWGDAGDNPVRKLMTRVYLPRIGRDFSAGLDLLAARFREQGE